jgi:hypothetical protein
MPEPTIKRRLAKTRDRELADDDGLIFRAVPTFRDVELKIVALKLRRVLRGIKYEEQR